MSDKLRTDTLAYHQSKPHGKLEIVPTKPCLTQRDLALAYTPGVAIPCLEIQKNPEDSYLYTARGNLVAVVTNGTAVLGLGNIGALAGKPVMEGKSLLFKRFADVDSMDIELNTEDPEKLIECVKLMEPTFGGINLEDIKAPECFEIEERLRKEMNIPVFHDDQHGTAIISGSALLNALELVGKKIDEVRMVFSGAGAAAVATARFYVTLGAKKENIIFCDRKGVIYKDREKNLPPSKLEFASNTKARTMEEALNGADVFVGLSSAGTVTPAMVKNMAKDPLIFAMANPDPEIGYHEAKEARPDAIVATGRSDYPNQVNNVLGFPFIFRGALDVRATTINEEMKAAAARALAALAHEDVPDAVVKAYGLKSLRFGPDYLIPKPLDPRVLLWVSPAVAKAAMDSGVARIKIDLDLYVAQLDARLGKSREVMRLVHNKAKHRPRRVALADGDHEKVIRAARQLADDGTAKPILVGSSDRIHQKAKELHIALKGLTIVDPSVEDERKKYISALVEKRQRKGVTPIVADRLLGDSAYFAAMMLQSGDCDAMVSGINSNYTEALKPILRVNADPAKQAVAGLHIVALRNRVVFFADTVANIDPDAKTVAQIAIQAANVARSFDIDPRVALLSFSNFGSSKHPSAKKMSDAVKLIREQDANLKVDGEMMADVALVEDVLNGMYPFNNLKQPANVLIFPNLDAGNIACKLVKELANAEVIGPIIVGTKKPSHLLLPTAEVKDIVNLASIAVVQAE